LDLLGVHFVEGFFDGSGDQVVSLLFDEAEWVGQLSFFSAWESFQGAVLGHKVLSILNVETLGVVDSTVVLDDGGNLAAILLEELGSPVANCAEALDDEGAILDSLGKLNLVAEVLVACKLADGVVDTETSGLVTTVDTALSDILTSAAALSVDVCLTLNILVGVLDPGHDLFVGSHVWAETVDSSANETLLDELHGVLAGHTLKLALREFTRVDLDASLTAAEWNISDSEFESHERSKGLNLLKIDVVGVSCAAFAWKLVSGVLSSVAGDGLKLSVVSTEGDVESDNCLASLNQVKILWVDASLCGS
jgi:hypothetical protein